MAEITVRYTGSVHGHPDPGTELTVERTDLIDALLRSGHIIEVEPENAANNIPEKVTPDAE